MDLTDVVSLGSAMKRFINFININSSVKSIDWDYLNDEKTAFFNALWFFSSDFYFKKDY